MLLFHGSCIIAVFKRDYSTAMGTRHRQYCMEYKVRDSSRHFPGNVSTSVHLNGTISQTRAKNKIAPSLKTKTCNVTKKISRMVHSISVLQLMTSANKIKRRTAVTASRPKELRKPHCSLNCPHGWSTVYAAERQDRCLFIWLPSKKH